MTICIAIAVYDGIVFAADSASSLIGKGPQGEPIITNVYKNGNKVFNLLKGAPLVAMTCGMGNFGRAPIATLTKDLRKLFSWPGVYHVNLERYTLEEVATRTQQFFKEQYERIDPRPDNLNSFEYWVGGYGSHSDLHEVWNFKILNGEVLPATPCGAPGDAGLLWGGQIEAATRLVMGYSPLMVDAMTKAGLEAESAKALLQSVSPLTQAQLVNAAMPIPDAIELADFLADTTKRFVRFLPGADTVGGEIDIATVTRHERFKWIRRKHYYPSQLNPLETDHV
jgi:hypothetical protein